MKVKNVEEIQIEQTKIRQFITDYLVENSFLEFINNILEKNKLKIQINESIESSINLTMDSFKHILSKIALNLSNRNQQVFSPQYSTFFDDIDV